MRRLSFAFLLISVASTLSASAVTTYYVNAAGATGSCACGNPASGCGSTASNPYACISDAVKASHVTQPGDLVLVADGTYNECPVIGRSQITIRAQHLGAAHIRCAATQDAVVFGSSACGTTVSQVRLEGFDIKHAPGQSGHGVLVCPGSNGNILSNVSVQDTAVNNSAVLLAGDNTVVANSSVAQNSDLGIEISSSSNSVRSGTVCMNTLGVLVQCFSYGHCSISTGTTCAVNCDCPTGETCVNPCALPTGNQIIGTDIERNNSGGPLSSEMGVKVSESVNLTVQSATIHHNKDVALAEGESSTGLSVTGSDIYSNGDPSAGSGGGFYIKGNSGFIARNKIHHNYLFGIQLYGGTYGTPTAHYIGEANDVFGNGVGMIIGAGTGRPPCFDGLPHYVELRYNTIHDNDSAGLEYHGGACGGAANGNSAHHNTIFRNRGGGGGPQVDIQGATGTTFTFKDNIIFGHDSPYGRRLVTLGNTQLDSNALNGNMYYLLSNPPSTADSLLFISGQNNTNPPCSELEYSFNQLKNTGILQACDPPYGTGCPNGALTLMETGSQWGDPLFVDPSTNYWGQDYAGFIAGGRRGDFHLRQGSPAICGGVLDPTGMTALDIDNEAPTICGTSPNRSGVGSDFYKDTDPQNTIADKFDCTPPGGICDFPPPDPISSSGEQTCTNAYPGAPYDPSVYPGAPEICDGKDDNCDNSFLSGGETDNDGDGFYASASGCAPGLLDCNDSNRLIFPGSFYEIPSNSIDDNCNGATDESDPPDMDIDGRFDCGDPNSDAMTEFSPPVEGTFEGTGRYQNLNAVSANNTHETIVESNSKKLTQIWEFDAVSVGKTYELRVEGRKTTTGNGNINLADNFDFYVITKTKTGNSPYCRANDTYPPLPILSISKPTDDDQLQFAGLGVISNPVVCVRVRDSIRQSDSQKDKVELDLVTLYQLPTCPDVDGDGYASSCSSCTNTSCPAIDCNDDNPLVGGGC